MPTDRLSRRRLLSLGGLSCSSMLAGCLGGSTCYQEDEPVDLTLPATGWPTLRADPAHTGTTMDVSASDIADRSELVGREVIDRSGRLHAPVIVDGVIYVSGYDTSVALDARTGDELWSVDVGDAVSTSGPTVAGDTVYFSSKTDGLWAVDRSTGERRFRSSPGGTITTPAHPVDGRLVVGTSDGVVYGLYPACGDVDWEFDADGTKRALLGTGGERIFVTTGSSIVALSPEDGTQRWQSELDSESALVNPAIAAGTVFVLDKRSRLTAVDARSGDGRWTVDEETPLRPTPPAVTAERVFVVDREDRLRAYETTSGSHLWTFDWRAPIETPPTLTDRGIVVASEETLHVVDPTGGTQIESAEIRSERYDRRQDVIVTADAVYLQSGVEAKVTLHRYIA